MKGCAKNEKNNCGKAKFYEHLGFTMLVSFSIFSPDLNGLDQTNKAGNL